MLKRNPLLVSPYRKFSSIARAELRRQGFTVSALITQYPNELKRLKLACDMGDTDFVLRAAREGEHFLAPAAYYVLHQATRLNPDAGCAGIPFPDTQGSIKRFCETAYSALDRLPPRFRTPEHVRAALKINGNALQYVDAENQTREMVLQAVRQNGRALAHADIMIDLEIALAAVFETGMALSYTPAVCRTREVCLLAVQSYGLAIAHVPQALLQDEAICRAAVLNNGDAFRYVPNTYRTAELFIIAAKQSAWIIEKHSYLLTPAVCSELVDHNPFLLGMLPLNMRSFSLCMQAVKLDGEAIGNVPSPHRTEELITTAVRSNPVCIDYLSKDEHTEAISRLAFSLDPEACQDLIPYPLIGQLNREREAQLLPSEPTMT